jgi:hypothetical protein
VEIRVTDHATRQYLGIFYAVLQKRLIVPVGPWQACSGTFING